METIYIDICEFNTGRFIFQMPYRHSTLFKIDMKDVANEILSRRPSLKGKKIAIHLGAERVCMSAQCRKKLVCRDFFSE